MKSAILFLVLGLSVLSFAQKDTSPKAPPVGTYLQNEQVPRWSFPDDYRISSVCESNARPSDCDTQKVISYMNKKYKCQAVTAEKFLNKGDKPERADKNIILSKNCSIILKGGADCRSGTSAKNGEDASYKICVADEAGKSGKSATSKSKSGGVK